MHESLENQWMTIPSFYLENYGGLFILGCNYDVALLIHNSVPGFYIDVLNAWVEARQKFRTDDQNSPRDLILWNN